jgi:phage terminase large subunit-like protein
MRPDQLVSVLTDREISLTRLTPFTTEHFALWASGLITDAGKSLLAESFQLAFLADVFAGIPECWLIVPEGNGKTTLIAALVTYVCEFSDMPSEIPVAGSSRDQAMILYKQAEGFVLNSESLYELVRSEIQARKGRLKLLVPRFNVQPGNRLIEHYRGGRIKVFAADERTGDGVIFRLAVLDELHRQRDLALYRTWSGKRLKRPGAQIIVISTAGEPGSEFENTRERIRQTVPIVDRGECFVRAVNASIALHEWAVPEDGDITDLALVARANPFSGVTEEALRAKYASPTMTDAHWRRFTCNLPTRSDAAAITEAEWAAARTDEMIPLGIPIWLGLDVGWKGDTTSMVPFLLTDLERRLFGPAAVLIPPRDGTSLDPHSVENALLAIHKRNPVHTVVMDTTRAEQLGSWIEETLGAVVVDRAQTNSFAALDCEMFLDGLRSGFLKHTGDPELTQHAMNAITIELPDKKMKFERPKQSRYGGNEVQARRVIDALVAAAMVHCVAVAEAQTETVEAWVAWS